MREGNVCCRTQVGLARRDRAWLIDAIAFALFLVLAGVLMAIPGKTWAVFALGLGVILLGRNLVRHLNGLRARRVSLVAGGGALVAGLAGLASPDLPLLAIFLAVTGIALLGLALFKSTTHRQKRGDH